MKTFTRIPAGVVTTALMCWAPTVALLLTVLLWRQPASRIPEHWTFNGTADGYSSSTIVFLWSLLPAVVGGIGAMVFLFMLGREARPRRAVLGFAITATASGLLSLQWVLGQTTAAAGVHDIISFPFLLTLAPIAWGVLALGIGWLSTVKAAAAMAETMLADNNE